MRSAILTERLTAKYGHRLGIENLDLEVRSDEVFGFIGPNGAGKPTTIRLLLDLLHPTSGRATVLGLDAHRESVAAVLLMLVGVCALTGAAMGAFARRDIYK